MICRAVSGVLPVMAEASTLKVTSPRLPPMRMASAARTEAHIARPSIRADTIVSRRSSLTTRSAAAVAAGVPRRPRAIPTSGEPDRGGVVGAVAGHRHDPAEALVRLHDADLVVRAAPGDDVRRVGSSSSSSASSSSSSSGPVHTFGSVASMTVRRRWTRRWPGGRR